jgi:putative DNA methylase
MSDFPRLIEHAFPLKQASLDSVHEKNVRHGHISTLHIWPARRPLAACRAALIATLLPDPGTPEARKELCEKIGGRVVKRTEKKKMPGGQTVERVKEETEGGILHWGRETENAETLEWFRQEIRKAYGGRAPKVLDPFAGGGAIPLEAMRLGCEATAVDINPVAWFILKCTLEYPQKLAGQTRPLPDFILRDDAFMAEFFKKAKGYSKSETSAAIKRLHAVTKKKAKPGAKQADVGLPFGPPDGADEETQADLAWHVRAWGQWVLARARKELAQYYPTYADFEPIKKDQVAYERQPMRLVPLKKDGTADIDSLNAEFTEDYLADKRNPRWIAKPTVAYLWARTVTCKNCRATVPLLKTTWLSKKLLKRVIVRPIAHPDGTVIFKVSHNVRVVGGNGAQRRENDRKVGQGTMSQSGAQCLHCPAIQTHEDIQFAATSDAWSSVNTAVVVDGENGKEFREVTDAERNAFALAVAQQVEPIRGTISDIRPSPNARGLSGLTRYGINDFSKVFNQRQVVALQAFVDSVIEAHGHIGREYERLMADAIASYMAASVDRLTDRNSTLCHWNKDYEKITGTFQRYALRVNWDYAEVNPFSPTTGNYIDAVEWIARFLDHASCASAESERAEVVFGTAEAVPESDQSADLILTDPPYYDAIPYSDLSDYYYVWLRRSLRGIYPGRFDGEVTDKTKDLIQHAGLAGGDNRLAKQRYEDGMARAFGEAHRCLAAEGRFVVVFAHKHPDAWETLVSAIIRAGFAVDASWPIQTEMPHKAAGGARLASSVWLVCKKRPAAAKPGWDNRVLEEMRHNIAVHLREFWDAGIRGPDFVWAATGPALEAYSKHPVVRKANEPNATMSVGEFLNHVRRMVVDYIVGQVLSGEKGADLSAADRLDEVTAYYLLHRHDFGLDDAPVGACILYATACGLSDAELERSWDILVGAGGAGGGDTPADDLGEDDDAEDDGNADADAAGGDGGGSKVKLKVWSQRKGRSLGYEAPEGKAVPLIDRIHRLMHLWKDGDLHKVDEYIDEHGLRRNELFKRVVQSLIELSTNSERSLLESISNHIGAKGAVRGRA